MTHSTRWPSCRSIFLNQLRAAALPASSSTTASSLAAAASNLISAIAQGSTHIDSVKAADGDAQSDAGSDQGASSFTYTAPTSAFSDAAQHGWYISTPYHIANRYYDVDIILKATKDVLATSHVAERRNADAVLSQSYPAYLVVVDRSRSLEYHRTLATSLESKVASGFDAAISIVAGVSLISSSHPQLVTAVDDDRPSRSVAHRQRELQASSPAKTSDLVALYADHGWEFIAMDELNENGSDGTHSLNDGEDDTYSNGDLEDDKDGIERIREALMNHMWNGLVRTDGSASSSSQARADNSNASVLESTAPFSSFSDAVNGWMDGLDADTNGTQDAEAADEVRRTAPSLPQLPSLDKDSDGSKGFPSLDLASHAEASDLDEQLAKLFLANSNRNGSADLAELEAFLESEDPSWPGQPSETSGTSGGADTCEETQTFEDDFDDFLPFQSAPRTASQPMPEPANTVTDDLPSMQDISQMQNRLFGSNAAARLEAGPLGMGSQPNSVAGQGDLACQLQQLQWHAQRVRSIQDPDQRRKEAALVALAFSMQWSTDDRDTGAGGMTF